jgi:hypothetical protein
MRLWFFCFELIERLIRLGQALVGCAQRRADRLGEQAVENAAEDQFVVTRNALNLKCIHCKTARFTDRLDRRGLPGFPDHTGFAESIPATFEDIQQLAGLQQRDLTGQKKKQPGLLRRIFV